MTRVRLQQRLRVGGCVTLAPEQGHHLVTVLRKRSGESVEAVDIDHQRWACTLIALEPVTLEVMEAIEGRAADAASELEFWLPLLKGGKTDDLVRQLSELGVLRIVVYRSQRAVVRLKGDKLAKRLQRWQTIALESTRQCGRLVVPEVRWSEGPAACEADAGCFFWEQAEPPAMQVLRAKAARGSLRLLVGPEGGLSVEEAERLLALGWQAMSLGPRILRAETAVVAGATLGMSALNEFGYGG